MKRGKTPGGRDVETDRMDLDDLLLSAPEGDDLPWARAVLLSALENAGGCGYRHYDCLNEPLFARGA